VYSQAITSGILLRQKISQLECTSMQTIYGLDATERVALNQKIKKIKNKNKKLKILNSLLSPILFYST
jgi:hypothetical protein